MFRRRIVNFNSTKTSKSWSWHLTSTASFNSQACLTTDSELWREDVLFYYLFCFFPSRSYVWVTSKGNCLGEEQKQISIKPAAITLARYKGNYSHEKNVVMSFWYMDVRCRFVIPFSSWSRHETHLKTT